MRFYYGADKLVKKPIYNFGNPNNDYGLGFYLTDDKEIARLWASKNIEGGYLIEYEVDLTGLKILELAKNSNENVLSWIALLISHRFSYEDKNKFKSAINFLTTIYQVNINDYDLIIGYRADDAYFDYSRDFVANELSLETLKKAMELGKLGKQFVLISKKAFTQITYIRSERVLPSNNYKVFRDKNKLDYFKLRKEDSINNTYLRDIMREKK